MPLCPSDLLPLRRGAKICSRCCFSCEKEKEKKKSGGRSGKKHFVVFFLHHSRFQFKMKEKKKRTARLESQGSSGCRSCTSGINNHHLVEQPLPLSGGGARQVGIGETSVSTACAAAQTASGSLVGVAFSGRSLFRNREKETRPQGSPEAQRSRRKSTAG